MPSEPVHELDDQSLFRRALLATDADEEDDEDDYWQCVEELRARGTRSVFDQTVNLFGSADGSARVLACNVLSQLGVTPIPRPPVAEPRQEAPLPFAERSVDVLIELCSDDTDPEVIAAAIVALGHLGQDRAVPAVVGHVRHADPDVRHAVASALPQLVQGMRLDPTHPAVGTLIELTRDAESHVRDWATFGVGSQVDVDGEVIRRCLHDRIADIDPDTADEALIGLARRHDPGAVALVLRRLADDTIGRLVLEAAAVIADPVLFEPLQRWVEPFSDETDWVREALIRCSPGRVDEEAAQVGELLTAAERAGRDLTVTCDLVAWDCVPTIAVDDSGMVWALDSLMSRHCGSVDAAIDVILHELTKVVAPSHGTAAYRADNGAED